MWGSGEGKTGGGLGRGRRVVGVGGEKPGISRTVNLGATLVLVSVITRPGPKSRAPNPLDTVGSHHEGPPLP